MRQADAPLKKITINIYASDYHYIMEHIGQDYSVRIRELIHNEVKQHREKAHD